MSSGLGSCSPRPAPPGWPRMPQGARSKSCSQLLGGGNVGEGPSPVSGFPPVKRDRWIPCAQSCALVPCAHSCWSLPQGFPAGGTRLSSVIFSARICGEIGRQGRGETLSGTPKEVAVVCISCRGGWCVEFGFLYSPGRFGVLFWFCFEKDSVKYPSPSPKSGCRTQRK